MERYEHLLNLYSEETPFCLVRFNDGEMIGVESVGGVVARGDQVVEESLHFKLKEALLFRKENYWIGKPCRECFEGHRELFDDFVSSDYPYQTHATVLINNGRWRKSVEHFVKNSHDRKVFWVGGWGHDLSYFRERTNFQKHIGVPMKNAWDEYEDLRDQQFPDNSVVFLSCGPMSRVLAKDYFERNDGLTLLDIGSLVDPIIKNVWYNCHTYNPNRSESCPECDFEFEDEALRNIGEKKELIIEWVKNNNGK